MTFILTLLSLFPRIVLGFLITNLIWKPAQTKYFLIKIFIAPVIGFGFSSLISFLWMWLGFSLNLYVKIEILLAVIFIFYLIIHYYKENNIKSIYLYFRETKEKSWFFVAALGLLGYMMMLIFTGLENPHGGFDAWYNWNIVSRFIYRGESDWQSTFLRNLSNTDYPLFLPISIALSWFYVQKETIFAPLIFHFVISLFTIGLFFAFIYAFKGLKQATLGMIFFVSQTISTSGMSQYADFPFSYIMLAIGGLTLLYLQTQEKQIAFLSGFLAGLAAWTKNEGFVTVIISTVIWGYIGWFYNRLAFKKYILGLIFPLGIVMLFKVFLAPSNEIVSNLQTMLDKILDFERYIFILHKFIVTFWSVGGGYIVVILLIYVLVVGKTSQSFTGLRIISVMILLQMLAYFGTYLVTPYDLQWHLKTSLSRLYLHIYPLFFLLFFMWLKSPDEIIEKEAI